jgi:hypothetical protein
VARSRRNARRHARVDERQLDVLERARARQEVEALEDEAEPRAADLGEGAAIERDTSTPAEQHAYRPWADRGSRRGS